MFFATKGYTIRATFKYISREQNPQTDYLARHALKKDVIMCFVVLSVMLMISPWGAFIEKDYSTIPYVYDVYRSYINIYSYTILLTKIVKLGKM
jgi:hypothetical protein